MIDAFMAGLDLHQPNWWIDLANETDLKEFAGYIKPLHSDYDIAARFERAKSLLRSRTANRFMVAVRAAIESNLVIDTKSIQDALGTAEVGRNLIAVASMAARAEREILFGDSQ